MQEQPRQLSACWAEGPSEVLEQVELRSRGRTLDRGAVVVARPPGVGCDQLRLLGDEQVEMVQPVRQLAGGDGEEPAVRRWLDASPDWGQAGGGQQLVD